MRPYESKQKSKFFLKCCIHNITHGSYENIVNLQYTSNKFQCKRKDKYCDDIFVRKTKEINKMKNYFLEPVQNNVKNPWNISYIPPLERYQLDQCTYSSHLTQVLLILDFH